MLTLLAETAIIGDGSPVTIGLASALLVSSVGAALWVGGFKADLVSRLERVIARMDSADATATAHDLRLDAIEKVIREFELSEARREGAEAARRKKTRYPGGDTR